MDPRIFPTVQILMNIVSAVAYGGRGDWRRAIYWIAAAILTTTVTW